MASEFALMKTAQAWQTKSTCDLPMQPALAEAFADILDACMLKPSEATQAQLGAPVEDRKVSASDPVSTSDRMMTVTEIRQQIMRDYLAEYSFPPQGKTHMEDCIDDALEAAIRENDRQLHDIEAYRGALGYSVSGTHNGLLSNGARPVCGMCAAWQALEEELL